MRALIWKNIEIKEKGLQEPETIFSDEVIKFTLFLKDTYKAKACYECDIFFDAQLYIILQKISHGTSFKKNSELGVLDTLRSLLHPPLSHINKL